MAFADPAFLGAIARQRAAMAESALTRQPLIRWTGTEKVSRDRIMTVDAASYAEWMARYELFPEIRTATSAEWDTFYAKRRGDVATTDHYATDPSGRWAYVRRILPRATTLQTYVGVRCAPGVVFDAEIAIPQLWERDTFRGDPWMSITPNEIITLRPGTRKAKGHVVVAGLGLGMQLIDVCARKQVKRVTLIEKEPALIEWLWPRIQQKCAMPVDVIVGDVYTELPKLTADVALVDTFPGYGHNDWERDRLRASCRGIGHVWCWGAFSTDD